MFLRFPGVSNREWERARSHGQASLPRLWMKSSSTPPQHPAQLLQNFTGYSPRASLLLGSQNRKNKSGSSPQNSWESLHYTITLNMFFLCSLIKEQIRILRKTFPQRLFQINFLLKCPFKPLNSFKKESFMARIKDLHWIINSFLTEKIQ